MLIILLTIISSEFVVSNTNLQRVKKIKCTSKKKLFELHVNITLVCLGLLDTNPVKISECKAVKTCTLRRKTRFK